MKTFVGLSRLTGMSKGYLSAIETGRSAPSVASLVRIARALDVEVGVFFNTVSTQDACVVVPRRARKVTRRAGDLAGLTYELLAYPKADKLMEPFIIDVAAKRVRYALLDHPGQEFLFVLQGTEDFQYPGERQVLRRGDAAYFDASVPHGVRAYRQRPAKVLSVICTVKR